MKNRIKLFVCVTLGFFVSWFIVGGINVAHAELKGGTIGLGTLSSLYCEIAGCTYTGAVTMVTGSKVADGPGDAKFYIEHTSGGGSPGHMQLAFGSTCTIGCFAYEVGGSGSRDTIAFNVNSFVVDTDAGVDELTIDDTSSIFIGDVDMDGALYVDSATGRIGINESSPGSLLTAVGYAASNAFFNFTVPDGDKTAGMTFSNTADSSEMWFFLSTDEKLRMTLSSDWSTTTSGMTMMVSGNTGLNSLTPASDLEIVGNLSTALAGTVAVTNGSGAVVGTGTAFTTALAVGDSIKVIAEIFTVSVITDATHLTLDSNYAGSTTSGLTAYSDSDLFDIQNGDGVNVLIVDKSGNVGINDSTPTAKLDISGTARIEDSATATCAADADDGVMYYRKIAGGSGLCICMFNGTTYELKATITLGTFTHSDC